MKVIFRSIPGHTQYVAGSDGFIYSTKFGKMRKLKPGKHGTGKRYLFVAFSEEGVVTLNSVHRMVCVAFHGPPPEGMEASHVNGDQYDNRPENLKWESRSENLSRREGHGTHDRGHKNSRALFTEEQVDQVKQWIGEGWKLRDIAAQMQCDERVIGKIKRGERYRT